jgi:hypothetical protein
MYIKLDEQGNVERFPYPKGRFKKDFAGMSIRHPVPDVALARFGIHKVTVATKPTFDPATQRLELGTPSGSGSSWTVAWNIVSQTQEQMDSKTYALTSDAREARNALLTGSDWTQLEDAQVDKPTWAAFRQTLRDVPSQPGFPETIIWPQEP